MDVLDPPLVVEVEYAPVALTSTTGRPTGLLSWTEPSRGGLFALGLDPRGCPMVEVRTGERSSIVNSGAPLKPGAWTRLAVLVTGTRLELHVDGQLVGFGAWEGGLPLAGNGLIGARCDTAYVEGLPGDAACGLIGSIAVASFEDVVAAQAAITESPARAGEGIDLVAALGACARADRHRPAYHLMPPAHWMNEPHGPIEVDGLHHVFYQANRKGPFWGGIEWGHAVSTDLVHWRHLPPALTPAATPVAPDGVWSGSTVHDDAGLPLIFFTAGDDSQQPNQSVARALPRWEPDGTLRWVAEAAPVVLMPAGDDLVPGQFRDPFVWRENDEWYMLVGAGVREHGGTALLFTSADGAGWHLHGPLVTGHLDRHPEVGEMWELPVLLPIRSEDRRERHVLVVCPWWETVPEARTVEVLYWVGRWDAGRRDFQPDHAEPRRLDYGRHFTGPSGTVLSDGRTILWSIAQDGRTTAEHVAAGWAHNAGLPLELSLGADGDLRMRPVRELALLRAEVLASVEDCPLEAAAGALSDIATSHYEIELAATMDLDGTPALLQLETHCEAGQAHATVTVDCAADEVSVHRPGAPEYDVWSPTTTDTGVLDLASGQVHLQVFVDASMLEVYVNGRRGLTTRVYAPEGASTVRLSGTPGIHLKRLRAWRLDPAAEPTTDHHDDEPRRT
jgi:sucrose-6-phosphate hydrolase SacC (GH32 family)